MSAAMKLAHPDAFPLPDAALTMHMLLLGKTRAGKSSVMRLIVERLLDEGKPVCIVDPKGDWWGLKSSRDGKRPGYPIVIFGGEHADVPINQHSGAQVAELVATGNRPALIDLGGWMVGERTRFFIDFASSFFKLTRGPRWLAIDEVHNFAPQGKVPDPQATMALHWANRLASEGAGKGVTLISASQRPQKVHKDYVTSHETLIAMRVIHELDRNANKAWMDGHGDVALSKRVLDSLASMERGEGWVWSPEAKFGPKRIRFPMFSTYDSFAAPTGEAGPQLKGWASVDLEEVRTKLAAAIETAKASDPKALKAEVARLQRELVAVQKHPAAAPAASPEALEAARAKGFESGFADGVQTGYGQGFVDALERTKEAITSTIGGLQAKLPAPRKVLSPPRPAPASVAAKPVLPRQHPSPVERQAPEGIGRPELKILEALAACAAMGFEQPTRDQLGAFAGYTASGGRFANLLGGLRTAGLVDYPTTGNVRLTAEGAAIAPAPDLSLSVRDRLDPVLDAPQAKILDSLPVDGSPVSRDELGAAAGYEASGGRFANLLGSLRTLGVITYPQKGFVAVEAWVFA